MTTDYVAAPDDFPAIRAISEQLGFCLVRGVFTRDEMVAIEAGLRSVDDCFPDKAYPDVLTTEDLRWTLFHAKVLEIARTLVGETLVYYGETSVNCEPDIGPLTLRPYNRLHCDARGMPAGLGKQW